MPQFAIRAMNDYLAACGAGDQETAAPPAAFARARSAAAQLLQARESEISFVGPTSLGLSYVASGLKFQRGENVVFYRDDYPSNVYPWQALATQGVELRSVETAGLGEITVEDVLGRVDARTRLVALASAHFISGWRLDHVRLGLELRRRGILFCLDAIQTLGAFPTSVEGVDFLAADGHKWLLAPCAAGLLYVRKEVQSQFQPPIYGWHNVRCPHYVAQEEMEFPKDGRRYEAGSHNLIGLMGLSASIRYLLEIGIEVISADLTEKRRFLVDRLQAKGYQVLNPSNEKQASGITTFFRPQFDPTPIYRQLTADRVIVSLREDRQGQKYLRLSPHFYNTQRELEKMLELV